MNKVKLTLLVSIGAIFLSGCTTTGYHKKVTVEKDGEGKIVKMLIEEEIHQPNLMQAPRTGKYLEE